MVINGRRQYGPLTQAPSIRRRSSRDVPFCDEAYDEDHIRIHGYHCTNRHHHYNWPSLSTEKYLLVGDSLIKFINRAKHLRVQAFPGARAQGLLNKVCKRQLRVEGYYIILAAIGTNDASDLTMPPRLAAMGIIMLMSQIRAINPMAILVVSGLLIRPKDQGTQVEYRRRLINTIVQQMCKERGYFFFKSWKCLMTGSNVRQRVYARDGIHLNRFGARHLYRRLEGNIRALEWRLN